VLSNSFDWHRQKCKHQDQERKKRKWLDSTLLHPFNKETHMKPWSPPNDDFASTMQFTINQDEHEEEGDRVDVDKSKTKCESCGSYLNPSGFEYHAIKCAMKNDGKAVTDEMLTFVTGNFHRSPMELTGQPRTFSVSSSVQRTWWHDLPAKAKRGGSIKTTQCPNCAATVLESSFEMHQKKCSKMRPSGEADVQRKKLGIQQRKAATRK